MATTVLAALKELYEGDGAIGQYVSAGVFLQVAPDNTDLTGTSATSADGGALVLDFKGMTWEKSTEYVRRETKVDLIFFHKSLEVLDQIVLPLVVARFDDQEAGVLLVEGADMISVDVAPDGEEIRMGLEQEKLKGGGNVFSLTVPLRVWTQHPRAE